MAIKVKGITIEIGGDTTKLEKSLKKVNSTVSQSQTKLRDIDKLLKFNPGNTELLAQKQKTLQQEITAGKEKAEQLKTALAQLKETGGDEAANQIDALNRELIETESKTKQAERELKKLGNVNMTALGQKMQAVGSKIKAAGQSMMAVSAVATGFLYKAVDEAAGFDKAMSQVRATMGITRDTMGELHGESVNLSDSLEKLAIDMGASTKFSAEEAAEAINYMALAGYNADQTYAVLPSVLNLAAAGDMELAAASDMVTDAMSALGMETSDADSYVDQLAKTASLTNTSVAQLGEGVLKIGANAKQLKGGTAELNTALGILANNGIKSAEGGTHLRNIMLSLQNPTDKAAGVLERLGVEVYDSEGKMRSLNDILGDLQNGMSGLTEAEKNEGIANIFNKTDLAAVNALLANTGKSWTDLQNAITDSTGAAGAMAETQLDNLSGAVTLLKSNLSAAAIAIGENLAPVIRKLAEFVTFLAERFNNLSPTAQRLIAIVLAIVAVMGPALVIIGAIVGAIGTAISAIGAMGGAITFLTGPVGIAIAVTGALVAALIYLQKHGDELRAKLIAAFKAIGAAAKKIFASIVGAIVTPFKTAYNRAKAIVDNLKSLVNRIKGFFQFKISAPHIPLPHFTVSPPGWKIGDLVKGKIPSLSVKWFAKGGIVNGATLIGAGEKGAEGIIPLDAFWNKMDAFANNMLYAMGNGGPRYIQNDIYLGGAKVGEQIVRLYDKSKLAIG